MARIAENKLTIEPLENGSFRLFGQLYGRQIRQRSRDFAKLAKLKETLEANLRQAQSGPRLQSTWLTEAQLRRAEAATLEANGQDVLELTRAGKLILAPDVKPKEWKPALDAWLKILETRHRRFKATLDKNRVRVTAFFRTCPATNVHEVTPAMLEAWILRPKVTPRTQLTDANVLNAFFKYCLKERWTGRNPLEVDLNDLAMRSGSKRRPRILTPDQVDAILQAAATMFDGKLLPFTVLSTWCFMRKAEVERTSIDDVKLTIGAAAVEVEPRKRGTPSYRRISIPENARAMLQVCKARGMWIPNTKTDKSGNVISVYGTYYNRSQFDAVRLAAGLIKVAPRAKRHARPKIIETVWQDHILRHTGLSYLYQKTGDIHEVCRQAGNSSDTSFKHYLQLPEPGACDRFYSLTVPTLARALAAS